MRWNVSRSTTAPVPDAGPASRSTSASSSAPITSPIRPTREPNQRYTVARPTPSSAAIARTSMRSPGTESPGRGGQHLGRASRPPAARARALSRPPRRERTEQRTHLRRAPRRVSRRGRLARGNGWSWSWPRRRAAPTTTNRPAPNRGRNGLMADDRIAEALRDASDTRAVVIDAGALAAVERVFAECFGDAAAVVVADETTMARRRRGGRRRPACRRPRRRGATRAPGAPRAVRGLRQRDGGRRGAGRPRGDPGRRRLGDDQRPRQARRPRARAPVHERRHRGVDGRLHRVRRRDHEGRLQADDRRARPRAPSSPTSTCSPARRRR